ncbi:hypothetical protein glysoja_023927 [Glycine soja]|nr:hypothetical protein glysoja_023927 [Glycine soja]
MSDSLTDLAPNTNSLHPNPGFQRAWWTVRRVQAVVAMRVASIALALTCASRTEVFPVALDACFENLKRLNDELSEKYVLLGNGLKPSEADVIVYLVIHSSLINLSDTNKEKLPHVLRWMDYIQHKQEFVGLFEKILLQKPGFEPPVTHPVGVVEADLKSNKTEQSVKNVSKSEVDSSKDKNKVEPFPPCSDCSPPTTSLSSSPSPNTPSIASSSPLSQVNVVYKGTLGLKFN